MTFPVLSKVQILFSIAAFGAVSLANAAPILSISDAGLSSAQSAEQAFLSSYSSSVTETFNSGYTVGSQQTTVLSQSNLVGFTSVTAGSGGACNATNGSFNYDCNAGLAVLDADASPFSGRFGVAPITPNNNWLDSMDARELRVDVFGDYTGIGFYMTDPNDSGGRFEVGSPSGEVQSFDFSDIFGSSLGNGNVFYITLFDQSGVSSFSIFSNASNDGYGIDNFSLAVAVPEPATLALMGLGLVGLLGARRRKSS